MAQGEDLGMALSFTPAQEMLKRTLRDFLKKECPSTLIRTLEEEESYPYDIFDKMAALGFFALPFPEQYGGLGGNIVDTAIIAEETARVSGSICMMYTGTAVFGGASLLELGSEEQKQTLLQRLCEGKLRMAWALTEPNAGSDAASIQTSAVRDGDDYVISGEKMFCTAADVADRIILAARTNKEVPKHRGITLFLLDRRSPGVTVRPIKKLAYNAIHTCQVFLDSVRLPGSEILGGLDNGWAGILVCLDNERIVTAAMATGLADGALTYACDYANQRQQFGRTIGKFQAIAHMLADMAIDVEAARWLTYSAAHKKARGQPYHSEASMAKAFATEVGTRTATRGMQVLGGYSYAMEFDMQRYYREAKLLEVAGGSTQIQRNIIARELGL